MLQNVVDYLHLHDQITSYSHYQIYVPTAPPFSDVEAVFPLNLILNCCHWLPVFRTIKTFLPSGVRKATFAIPETSVD